MKTEIHKSLSNTSNDRLQGQKEALKMMGLGNVDLGEQEPVATPASQAPDMTSVESQISMLQQMLPKIKDAGQRAGLVKHFAPKIEDAMAQVEKEIQDKK